MYPQKINSMKKIAITLCAAFIIMTAFVAHNHFMSGIRGTISPPDGAKKIWAISGRDTASIISSTGNFSLDLKPGNWKLYIEAAKPYKDFVIPNILVEQDRYYDAGEIKLTKD
jgi:hypothetical protein